MIRLFLAFTKSAKSNKLVELTCSVFYCIVNRPHSHPAPSSSLWVIQSSDTEQPPTPKLHRRKQRCLISFFTVAHTHPHLHLNALQPRLRVTASDIYPGKFTDTRHVPSPSVKAINEEIRFNAMRALSSARSEKKTRVRRPVWRKWRLKSFSIGLCSLHPALAAQYITTLRLSSFLPTAKVVYIRSLRGMGIFPDVEWVIRTEFEAVISSRSGP